MVLSRDEQLMKAGELRGLANELERRARFLRRVARGLESPAVLVQEPREVSLRQPQGEDGSTELGMEAAMVAVRNALARIAGRER